VGSAIAMGTVTTLVLVSYGLLASSNEDLFWNLFAASAVLFILPYIGVIAAFRYARSHDAERPRPFRVPGGNGLASVITVVCIGLLLMTALLFMYVPGTGFDWPVVTGAVVSILFGEAMILLAEHQKRS
jgi:amino acid transporter